MMKRLLCSTCKNMEICKFSEEYKRQFESIRETQHSLFEHTLTCSKYDDVRPSADSLETNGFLSK